MRRALFVVLASLLTACSSGATLNTAMAGTWFGTYSATFPGAQPISYSGQLILAVSGETLTASDICPDNSGTLSATGSGNTATWTGTLACPAHTVGTCSSVAYTFTSATMTLSADGTMMTAQGSGTFTGCGNSGSFIYSFTGHH